MMKPRNLVLLLLMSVAMLGPGTALAADEPATSSSVSSTADDATDTAPLTLTQEQIDALQDQGQATDDNQSAFEKASDFVTDHAPWFIIGIIVLAAIIAGILIMRGRPRKAGTPKASKSTKQLRNAGGNSADEPAQVPSASELRRRKRAAVQRSREEERLRRKSGIENRKASRRGGVPAPVAASAAGATAVTAAGVAAGGLDPVEAEKQGARDQETAAAAMARFGAGPEAVSAAPAAPAPPVAPQAEPVPQVPPAPPQPESAPAAPPQTIPAPVSPSQTAPAAGVVTPDQAPTAEPQDEPYTEPEAEIGLPHEPSIENPGPDAAVGNAARDFLAGGAVAGAAGALGGVAAARANQPETPDPEPVDSLDPVVSPEPGMTVEHALADVGPIPAAAEPVPEPAPPEAASPEAPPVAGTEPDPDAAAAAEDRLRAKVAEIKATQESTVEPVTDPEPAVPAESTDLEVDAGQASGLAAVERRLSENSEERDRTLRDAEERLRRVEQRAQDAERRAAFAERLAQLKVEESERDKRLNEVVSGIDRAEQRAREAEARAEAAEKAAAAALERSDLNRPSPNPPAELTPEPTAPEPPAAAVEPPSPTPMADEPPLPERRGLFSNSAPVASGSSSDAVNLNGATFEELREAGLSVTQATRILAYRERFGGYSSVEDLEKVPGFPADLIESLRTRLTI